MSGWMVYALLFGAGLGVGLLYFGGLWLTVVRVTEGNRPVAWLGLSFLTRIGVALALLYWLAAGEPLRLLILIAGFFAMRLGMTYYRRPWAPT